MSCRPSQAYEHIASWKQVQSISSRKASTSSILSQRVRFMPPDVSSLCRESSSSKTGEESTCSPRAFQHAKSSSMMPIVRIAMSYMSNSCSSYLRKKYESLHGVEQIPGQRRSVNARVSPASLSPRNVEADQIHTVNELTCEKAIKFQPPHSQNIVTQPGSRTGLDFAMYLAQSR
jgi:hypothetical protein